MFDHAAMERMGGVRKLRCDTKERASGDILPVRKSVDFDQGHHAEFWEQPDLTRDPVGLGSEQAIHEADVIGDKESKRNADDSSD